MTGERVAKFPTPRFPDGEIEYVPLPRSSEDMLIELHREIGNQPKTRSARLYQLHHEIADHIDTLRAQVAALAGEKAADKARLDWIEAQFADHNRDCNLTFNRFQYDQELSLDAEGASWSRMTIRSSLDAARGGEG